MLQSVSHSEMAPEGHSWLACSVACWTSCSQCWLEVCVQLLFCIQRFLCSRKSLLQIFSPAASTYPPLVCGLMSCMLTHCKSYLDALKVIVGSKQTAGLTRIRSVRVFLGQENFFLDNTDFFSEINMLQTQRFLKFFSWRFHPKYPQ